MMIIFLLSEILLVYLKCSLDSQSPNIIATQSVVELSPVNAHHFHHFFSCVVVFLEINAYILCLIYVFSRVQCRATNVHFTWNPSSADEAINRTICH